MITIHSDLCTKCGMCVSDCFFHALSMSDTGVVLNPEICIACGHCIAICPTGAVFPPSGQKEQVIPLEKLPHEIHSEAFLGSLKARRSIRKFKKKVIEKEKTLRVLEAGRYSPTASNMEDNSYVVVEQGLQELRGLILEALNERGEQLIQSENQDPQLLRYAYFWQNMYKAFHEDPDGEDLLFFHAPQVIFVLSQDSRNGMLAAASMTQMAYVQGLGTVYSGFCARAAQSKKVKEFLCVPEGKAVVIAIVMGYPDIEYHRIPPRKPLDAAWR